MGNCASAAKPEDAKKLASLQRERSTSDVDERNEISTIPAPITNYKQQDVVAVPDDQPGFANFKRAVGRVLDVKRMWAKFWAQLDEAEERELFLKAELENAMRASLDSRSGQFSLNKLSRNTGERVRTRAPSRNGNYVQMIEKHGINANDLYKPENTTASAEFLWNLTQIQKSCREEVLYAPGPSESYTRKSRDFEVANLHPLDDESVITQTWIDQLINELKQERVVSYQDAFHILRLAVQTFMSLPNVPVVHVPQGTQITMVGDIHGQLDDLLMVFRESGKPSPTNYILFNGDFVDRGSYSCECLLVILAYRAAYPEYVYLNRGNHECTDMNSVDGFLREAEVKYSRSFWFFTNHVFATLPVAHFVHVGKQRVFVVHAGLSFEDITIADINQEDRFKLKYPVSSILQDLLWSDPQTNMGRIISKRGAGCLFGPDVCARFLVKNNCHLIVRSHECEDNGFALWFDNRLYTIFSASDYCGDSGNYGAVCIFNDNPAPQIRVYMAKKQVLKYSDRQKRNRQMILSKLLVRIANKIFELEEEMMKYADNEGYISSIVWSVCLQLGLDVDGPYRCIADKLGLSLDTKRVHVKTWCDKFKPKDMKTTTIRAEEKLKYRIGSLLYDTTSPFKNALETLFQHFDVDSDGSITLEEFHKGLVELMSILDLQFTQQDVAALVQLVDSNQDGEVDYNEFFSAFAFGTISLEHIEV